MATLLTAKQVEEILNIDRTTIYRMLKDGRLSGVKIGQHWRFDLSSVEALLRGNSTGKVSASVISSDVLPIHCMQPIQGVFAEIAEVGAVTTDKEGQPLTKISNSCDFCKLILGTDAGRAECIRSWKNLASQREDKPDFVKCHAGLEYARAKIEVDDELIAILVAGQFYLNEPDSEEETRRIESLAKKFGINPDLLKQAAKHITVLDEKNVIQIASWLQRVSATFEQISSERATLMGRLKQISSLSEI